MTSNKIFADIIPRFAHQKILVLGDFIMDVFVHGLSTRLCPEAPVPVVDVTKRTICAGGAANTAANLIALGASVTLCAVLGDDTEGNEAIDFLRGEKWNTHALFKCPRRKTIAKTRVVVGSQVITRIDDGTIDAIDADATASVHDFLTQHYHTYDAILLSDYGKGFFTEKIREVIATLQRRHQKFLVIDSKRLDFFKSLRPSVVKPNYEEAIRLLGLSHRSSNRLEQFRECGTALHEITGARLISLTMDTDGAILFEDGKIVSHSKAMAVHKPQVSGAGDAYISAFALSYLVSKNASISTEIAIATAGIAITKETTATCTVRELKSYFNMQGKLLSFDDLDEVCCAYRASGKRIVFTNGCFDILHSGHVAYLDTAREFGDVLIIGLNTDESIRRIKGPTRPVNNFIDRMAVLAGLKSVDHIVAFGEESDDTPAMLIREVRPDAFVKGGDYVVENLPELSALQEIGTEIVIVSRIPDRSTSAVIQKINQLTDVSA